MCEYLESVTDALYILLLVGFDRSQSLSLPHWEFWQIIRSHRKYESMKSLDRINGIIAGVSGGDAGEKIIRSLQRSIGISTEEKLIEPPPVEKEKNPENEIPWTIKLKNAIGAIG